MSDRSVHVVPNGAKWSIRRTGSVRVTGTFDTEEEAVERGTELARSQGTELYIFGRDGQIHQRNSFRGGDAHPPKG